MISNSASQRVPSNGAPKPGKRKPIPTPLARKGRSPSWTRVLRLADEREWNGLLERLPEKGLCHFPRFSRVYEEIGEGVAECFAYGRGDELILYLYIRRPLSLLSFGGGRFDGYCDITTPYCYGGFIHNAADEASAGRLTSDFRAAFEAHARETKIVTEFIRFNPLLKNHRFCDGFFSRFFLYQNNIMVDLEQSEDSLLKQCRPTFRRYIRKAVAKGLRLEQADLEKNIDLFAGMYSRTMARHNQTGYLNFSRNYFEKLFSNLHDDLLLFTIKQGADVAAMALFLSFDGQLDYFLGCSEEERLPLHPNHFLFHKVSCWASERGYKRLHLGGGRDSLVYFKSGFSKVSEPYYVASHIHDIGVYEELIKAQADYGPLNPGYKPDFFPAYRKGVD